MCNTACSVIHLRCIDLTLNPDKDKMRVYFRFAMTVSVRNLCICLLDFTPLRFLFINEATVSIKKILMSIEVIHQSVPTQCDSTAINALVQRVKYSH